MTDAALAGRRALVTGGAGGIGMASARLLMAEGAKVVLLDRDADALRDRAAAIPAETVSSVARRFPDMRPTLGIRLGVPPEAVHAPPSAA